MEKREIQSAFIDALENDAYQQQDQNYLKLSTQYGDTYCVLGVIAQMAENLDVIKSEPQIVYVAGVKIVSYKYCGNNLILSQKLCDWIGLKTPYGGDTHETNFPILNAQYSFSEIARLIKKKPKNFFI